MINAFVGVGRITKDPVIQKTTSGISTVKFTIAVERDRKDSTGKYPADFIQCQAWRSSADFLGRYAHKGTRIAVTGRIETGSYESNGKRNYTWVVNCESVNLLDSYGTSQPQRTEEPAPAPYYEPYPGYPDDAGIEVYSDDMPF